MPDYIILKLDSMEMSELRGMVKVAMNLGFVMKSFHFSYEDLSLKTGLTTDSLKLLGQTGENAVDMGTGISLIALCKLCNYLTIRVDDFYLKDISKEVSTAAAFLKLLKEHKNSKPYDREPFYDTVLQEYRSIQLQNTSAFTDLRKALLKAHALYIDENEEGSGGAAK